MSRKMDWEGHAARQRAARSARQEMDEERARRRQAQSEPWWEAPVPEYVKKTPKVIERWLENVLSVARRDYTHTKLRPQVLILGPVTFSKLRSYLYMVNWALPGAPGKPMTSTKRVVGEDLREYLLWLNERLSLKVVPHKRIPEGAFELMREDEFRSSMEAV